MKIICDCGNKIDGLHLEKYIADQIHLVKGKDDDFSKGFYVDPGEYGFRVLVDDCSVTIECKKCKHTIPMITDTSLFK